MEKTAKVLLIQPNYNIGRPNQFTAWMPIALVELATFVREMGHDAKILDRNLYCGDDVLLKALEEFKPDIVGMTCYTSLIIKDVIKISRLVKENSKAMVIVGGIHATLEPKSLLDIPTIDYIVRGEGELALLEICNLIKNGKTKRKDILKVKNVNYNEMRPLIDLNILPMPNYDLLDVRKYRITTFYTSRGCMGKCKFCYNRGRKLRFYNTEKVIKLMTGVIEKYNIKEFTIADDNFATLGERTERICNALSKYNVIFHCFMRVDQAHDEVMKNLKKAGCWAIQFGFESGNQRILDFINKGTTVAQNIKAIEQCRKYKIFIDGSFIIGLPTETEQEMMDTVRFLRKYKPDVVSLCVFKPYPRTELYDYCIKKGLIKQPQTIEQWIPFCNINKGEPNFSEIPTERIIKTTKEFNNYSHILYFKKFLLLLLNGHGNYALFKIRNILRTKLKNINHDYS